MHSSLVCILSHYKEKYTQLVQLQMCSWWSLDRGHWYQGFLELLKIYSVILTLSPNSPGSMYDQNFLSQGKSLEQLRATKNIAIRSFPLLPVWWPLSIPLYHKEKNKAKELRMLWEMFLLSFAFPLLDIKYCEPRMIYMAASTFTPESGLLQLILI